jgi:hypothetical protein
MAACYSADEDGTVCLPYDPATGELIQEVWARWQAWDPVRMVASRGARSNRMPGRAASHSHGLTPTLAAGTVSGQAAVRTLPRFRRLVPGHGEGRSFLVARAPGARGHESEGDHGLAYRARNRSRAASPEDRAGEAQTTAGACVGAGGKHRLDGRSHECAPPARALRLSRDVGGAQRPRRDQPCPERQDDRCRGRSRGRPDLARCFQPSLHLRRSPRDYHFIPIMGTTISSLITFLSIRFINRLSMRTTISSPLPVKGICPLW